MRDASDIKKHSTALDVLSKAASPRNRGAVKRAPPSTSRAQPKSAVTAGEADADAAKPSGNSNSNSADVEEAKANIAAGDKATTSTRS